MSSICLAVEDPLEEYKERNKVNKVYVAINYQHTSVFLVNESSFLKSKLISYDNI